jgi:hypothetical protein
MKNLRFKSTLKAIRKNLFILQGINLSRFLSEQLKSTELLFSISNSHFSFSGVLLRRLQASTATIYDRDHTSIILQFPGY